MIDELEKMKNFCCICGDEFPKEGVGIKSPGDTKGTWQCISCTNAKDRQELISKKSPAYITFTQFWDKIPGRIRIEIPFKNRSYFKANKIYQIMIWED